VKESNDVLGCLPSPGSLLIEDFGTGLVIHAPFGTRANETLGIVVAALLTTRMGIDVGVERDPYRILLTSTGQLDPDRVVDILRGYNGTQVSSILRLAVKHTQSFSSRFVHVARRMGVIRREARTKDIPVRRLIANLENGPVFEEAMREILQEKLDEQRVRVLFDGISGGLIDIRVVNTTKPSPLARLIVEEKTRFEIIGEITDENEVLRLVENRLTARQLRLVCLGNDDWDSVRTISTLGDTIECPNCGSRMIAVISPSDSTLTTIVKMRRNGKTLTDEETTQYSAAVLTAELVSTYGKKALMVLAAHGIGPRTASRVLQSVTCDRLALLREIVRAEREYARTRPFWQ
jgi:ATP-dependent Lhr-like helicase